jgi:hypothetical protein
MICSTCIHLVIQKYNYGDVRASGEPVLKDVMFCDILKREVVKLVECSRYKTPDVMPKSEVVDLGYGAVPSVTALDGKHRMTATEAAVLDTISGIPDREIKHRGRPRKEK